LIGLKEMPEGFIGIQGKAPVDTYHKTTALLTSTSTPPELAVDPEREIVGATEDVRPVNVADGIVWEWELLIS
jgi:hypothetical protein